MSIIQGLLLIYGILLMAGAFIGFKAGSKISLIAGLVSGILILFGVYYSHLRPVCGYGLTAVVSGILVLVFLLRFLKTHQFMPSGMLLLMSLIAFGIALSYFLHK